MSTQQGQQAPREHLTAAKGAEPATNYHQTVTGFRVTLMWGALFWQEVLDRYKEPVLQARPSGPRRNVPAEVLHAHGGSMMASSYAYTLAAVIGFAERELGADVARALAFEADEILTNGDDGDLNADVVEAARKLLGQPHSQEAGPAAGGGQVLVRYLGGRRPRIVCLCGSTRFKDEINAVNARLSLEGNLVISAGLFRHADMRSETRHMLDELHERKIDLADEVCVVNAGGQIGESTRSQIEYAASHGKPVRYLEITGHEECNGPVCPVCGACACETGAWGCGHPRPLPMEMSR